MYYDFYYSSKLLAHTYQYFLFETSRSFLTEILNVSALCCYRILIITGNFLHFSFHFIFTLHQINSLSLNGSAQWDLVTLFNLSLHYFLETDEARLLRSKLEIVATPKVVWAFVIIVVRILAR